MWVISLSFLFLGGFAADIGVCWCSLVFVARSVLLWLVFMLA